MTVGPKSLARHAHVSHPELGTETVYGRVQLSKRVRDGRQESTLPKTAFTFLLSSHRSRALLLDPFGVVGGLQGDALVVEKEPDCSNFTVLNSLRLRTSRC